MPTKKTAEEKLAALKAQKQKLDQRIQRQQSAIKSKKRRDDTRRKIIAGALALEHREYDADFAATLNRLIAKNVTRADDKKLFGLD